MEDDAAEPGPPLNAEEELKQRLERLEREAAELREALKGNQQPTPEEPKPPQEQTQYYFPPAGSGAAPQDQAEPTATPAPVSAEEEVLVPPTQAQIDAAENYLRQARLAKTRGQGQQAMTFLQQAESVAPNAPTVLEFIGDELAEKGHFRNARETYAKALKLESKNVRIENKYGLMVLKSSSFGTMADPLGGTEIVAGAKSAFMMSVFIPGLGQIVLGDYIKGAVYAGVWIACLIWIIVMRDSVSGLISSIFGHRIGEKPHYSNAIFFPLIVGVLVYVTSLFDAGAKVKHHEGRITLPTRPEPPANLPFE